ncbi:MAG: hypothetical protein DWQ44_10155 [Bacteroidetes bacterium]|nr:MAG: hypothetical protein DWQ33_10430 [Bacteroidota bacterium]REK06639.1 MAG: hypothetical protein DWQ39_03945 [Bacteroidota bacterium]REK33405.1 MAG: hypothetical protein DWQ44_10155 [Bacteroidota bacterium]REK49803.1 MAG: hypothetical protein DWQ48_06710 [Bacteroidota bacterium]
MIGFRGFILLAILAQIIFSCEKSERRKDEGVVVPGNLMLEAKVVHHTWEVPGVWVYLKRNAVEFPGYDSTLYEFKLLSDSYGTVLFENLYPGNYYLYASGYDAWFGANVRAYVPITLSGDSGNKTSILLMAGE